jgi:WD40 repeat protein
LHESDDHTSSFLFTPDGKTLLDSRQDATIIWDIATKKELRRLSPPLGVPLMSADGKVLCLRMQFELFKLHEPLIFTFADLESGKEIRKWQTPRPQHGAAPRQIRLTADGKILAVLDDYEVNLFDAINGKRLHCIKPQADRQRGGNPTNIIFSEDGKKLIWTNGDQVQLWNTASGRLIRRYSPLKDGMSCFALAPGAKVIAAGAGQGTIVLCDLMSGQPLRVLRDSESALRIQALAFSPDGKTLASQQWVLPTIRLWDVTTGKEITSNEPPFSKLEALAFVPPGATLVSVGLSDRPRLWDARTGNLLRCFEGSPLGGKELWGLPRIAVSPNAQTLVLDRGAHLSVWDFPSGKLMYHHPIKSRQYFHPTFWPNSRTILTSFTVPFPGEAEKMDPRLRPPPKVRETIIGLWDARAKGDPIVYRVNRDSAHIASHFA